MAILVFSLFYKTSSCAAERRYSQKLKVRFHCQNTCVYFSSFLYLVIVIYVFWGHWQNICFLFDDISLKYEETNLRLINNLFISRATFLINSWYEPHDTYFLDVTFYCTKEIQKTQQIFFLSLLSHGWNSLLGACSDLDLIIHD